MIVPLGKKRNKKVRYVMGWNAPPPWMKDGIGSLPSKMQRLKGESNPLL